MNQYCNLIKGPQRPDYVWNLIIANDSSTTAITNNFKVEFDGDISVINKDDQTVSLKFNAYPPVLPPFSIVAFSYNNSLLDATSSTNVALGGNGLAVPGYVTGANINVTAFPDGYLMYTVPHVGVIKDLVANVVPKSNQTFTESFDVRCVLLISCRDDFPVFCPVIDFLVGNVPPGTSDPTFLFSNGVHEINYSVNPNNMLLVLFYSNSSTTPYSFNVSGSFTIV